MRLTRELIRRRLEPLMRLREANGSVEVYVRDDDKLRSVGEPFELVGYYTSTAEVGHIVSDVLHWYDTVHPVGRGRSR